MNEVKHPSVSHYVDLCEAEKREEAGKYLDEHFGVEGTDSVDQEGKAAFIVEAMKLGTKREVAKKEVANEGDTNEANS